MRVTRSPHIRSRAGAYYPMQNMWFSYGGLRWWRFSNISVLFRFGSCGPHYHIPPILQPNIAHSLLLLFLLVGQPKLPHISFNTQIVHHNWNTQAYKPSDTTFTRFSSCASRKLYAQATKTHFTGRRARYSTCLVLCDVLAHLRQRFLSGGGVGGWEGVCCN